MTYSGEPSFGVKVRNRVRLTENSVFTLARVGDISGIMEAFKRREASINDLVYHSGQTILQVALELGHIETCKFLIQMGIDPYVVDDRKHSAAMEISLRILQKTNLRRGPEMETAFTQFAAAHSEIWDFSHVHKVVVGILHADLQQTLHDPVYHAQVNSVDCRGRTPLHWAALRGDEETIKILLLAGAVSDVVSQQNRAPLHYAIVSGSIPCVERLLMTGYSVNRRDIQGHAALHVAAWARDMPAMIETIYLAGAALEAKDNSGCTALECAANMNYARNIEYLLSVGADIECRDSGYDSPLLETVRYGNCEALQVLLDHGARIDYANSLGQTILHLAAAYGNFEVVRRLRRRRLIGLNGLEMDGKGRTAMDVFAERATPPEGLAEALRDLIDHINGIEREHEDANWDEEDYFADAVEHLEL
jgi:ankyrin repeat protein